MASARSGLGLQSGGGEVLAGIPHPPSLLVAKESWRPNVTLAQQNLRPLRASVVEVVKSRPVVYDDHHTNRWCCC